MNLKLIHRQKDSRIDGRSLLISTTLGQYLELTKSAYQQRGSIEGQRAAVKTTSALRIRSRMRADFELGAILPPVVLGILVAAVPLEASDSWSDDDLNHALQEIPTANISIIDGMQRTTVFNELGKELLDREIRVELWLVKETSALTYRMLVLNTGQVPWNLRRQIEVINTSLLSEIRTALQDRAGDNLVPGRTEKLREQIKIFGVDDNHRRTEPGEFQANEIIEMYLSFGLRKEKVDTETVLADQFSRLDMVDAVSNANFLSSFVATLLCLIQLDFAFSRHQPAVPSGRFSSGRKLFDSVPACVGFMAAAAQRIYGRPGSTIKDLASQERSLEEIIHRCDLVVKHVSGLPVEELGGFLDFEVLNEITSQSSVKIGDYEREVFVEAFRVFFSAQEELSSMTAYWRAR
ncbi:hypothetical protein OV208_21300 [Corallococcus sp. bb12-1]|uniref:hypothetical protein n=1 Tax=Corallococcus sp. bb12-1 TaxID=2996784 RepID=UPI00226FE704|nr:hypothetical protein [Corallococcus sp. bb12-1]MCY1043869.1 hypothetical protein [Corallococcus sp. bb12-1]